MMQTHASTADYFLTDALGSVRQLTDPTGAITFARTYDPYGVTTQTTGAAQTAYGYTNEYSGDSTQLVNLRARQYTPSMGCFLTRDTWSGNSKSPMSYNKWNYVGGNPINRTDHSGRCWYPNLQSGGISEDITVPSSGICPWFTNVFQSNGITIPANATPENWLNSIPPEHQAIISAFVGCPFQNGTSIGAGNGNIWQVIVFYTKPKWHFYKQANTVQLDVDLTLIGAGGEVAWSCNNDSPECTGSYNYSLGEGISKFKLKVGGELDIVPTTGDVHLGATVKAGPCNLFTSLTKISVACSMLFGGKFQTGEQIEFGWQTDFPDIFWVFANTSNFSSMSYEQFAKRRLPFHDKNEKIYSEIKRTGSRQDLYREFSSVFAENGVSVFP